MRNTRKTISWSNLPTEVVRLIASRIQNKTKDLHSFRLTCKKWRQSTAISTILPHFISSTPRQKLYLSSVILLRPQTSRSIASSSYSPWMISAVEPTKGNIQFCHPFSKTPLFSWSLTQGNFNFDRFRATELAVAYHLTNANDEESDHTYNSEYYDKVLLCTNSSVSSINDCVLLCIHEGGRLGGYLSFKIEDEDDEIELELPWIEIKQGSVTRFDDIAMHKGMILVLDRQGKVYKVDRKKLEINSTLVDRAISQGRSRTKASRRRLVVCSAARNLYLVEKVSQRILKVYKLHEQVKSGTMWVEVKKFGDKVMFVTRDYSFFTSASKFSTCSLNNCIVFSNDAFPKYGRTGWEIPDSAPIYVFRLGGKSEYNFKPISSFSGFPLLLWSCPSWAWNAGSSHCQCRCQSHDRLKEEEEEEEEDEDGEEEEEEVEEDEKEEDEEEEKDEDGEEEEAEEEETAEDIQFDLDNPDGAPAPELVEQYTAAEQERIIRDKVPSPFITKPIERTFERPSVSAAHGKATITTTMNRLEQEAEEENLREETFITHSVSWNSVTTRAQNDEIYNSTVKFEGLYINSKFLPTLQIIWAKQGNLVENCSIRNGELIAKALESLATIVLILEKNSARSLSDSNADYLSSTLSDLQRMHFKVDWLVPFVEKAVGLHKAKPLINSINKLGDYKAQVVERRSKLLKELAELDKLEKELKEDIAYFSKVISFSGNLDLEQALGGVLS